MKSLFAFFNSILSFFKNRKKNKTFTKINKKLATKLKDREVERIILKGKILKMVKEYIAINTSSKFIPPWYKSNAEIREEILNKYGEEMKVLEIKIYHNLKLSA